MPSQEGYTQTPRPMPSPRLVSDPWPRGRAGLKHLQGSYCFSVLLSTPDAGPQSVFQWPKWLWQVCAVRGKDSQGTLPRPCTAAYGPEDRSVSRHSLRYHSWCYTSRGCSWSVTWSLTLFGGMQAQSLSPQQSGCLSTALDWGSWRAHHTPPTKQRGMTIPSPCPWAFLYHASCHWSQRQPRTGDHACKTQMRSVFPVIPLLLRIVEVTAPNKIQGNAD